MKYSTQSP